MTVNPHDTPARQIVDRLLDELGIDQDGAESPGAVLGRAINAAICQAEIDAVGDHGRQILAAIEGTLWAGHGDVSTNDVNDSALVQMLNAADGSAVSV